MSALHLLTVCAAAGLGGVIGGLVPVLVRRLRRRHEPARAAHHLDPYLQQRVHDLSAAWAARRGHPGAGPLAAGYLMDTLLDVQDRWEGRR